MYIGYGAFGFRVDVYVVLWGVVFLGSVWFTFSSFGRAFKPCGTKSKNLSDPCPNPNPTEVAESNQMRKSGDIDMERVNEKLAPLLQKPKDDLTS